MRMVGNSIRRQDSSRFVKEVNVQAIVTFSLHFRQVYLYLEVNRVPLGDLGVYTA